MASDDETGRRLASRSAHPSSLARSALRRQTPKVGAGCSNWARPDPCGGCPAMGIPTAIYTLRLFLERFPAALGSSRPDGQAACPGNGSLRTKSPSCAFVVHQNRQVQLRRGRNYNDRRRPLLLTNAYSLCAARLERRLWARSADAVPSAGWLGMSVGDVEAAPRRGRLNRVSASLTPAPRVRSAGQNCGSSRALLSLSGQRRPRSGRSDWGVSQPGNVSLPDSSRGCRGRGRGDGALARSAQVRRRALRVRLLQ